MRQFDEAFVRDEHAADDRFKPLPRFRAQAEGVYFEDDAMGLEGYSDIAQQDEVAEAFGDAALFEINLKRRSRRNRFGGIEMPAQEASELRDAASQPQQSPQRSERTDRNVEQTRLGRRDGNPASGRRHPMVDFNLHIAECDELDVLNFAFRQNRRRVSAFGATRPDARIADLFGRSDGRLTIDASPAQSIDRRLIEQTACGAFDFDLPPKCQRKVIAVKETRLTTRTDADANAAIRFGVQKSEPKNGLTMRAGKRHIIGFRLHLQTGAVEPEHAAALSGAHPNAVTIGAKV